MKKGIFLLITLIACALVLASCTQSDGHMRKLQQVDSLMENNPQAAYDSLCLYGKEVEREKSQKISMRYRLLMAKAQNKLFLAMPSDSAFQEVVDYYESREPLMIKWRLTISWVVSIEIKWRLLEPSKVFKKQQIV